MIVADTNVIAYLLIPGARTEHAKAALLKDPHWTAPVLWRSEFRNVLAFYLWQNEFTINQALLFMQEAELLMHGEEYEVASPRVLSLTESSKCSAYDCEFVALAQELGARLLTSDTKILAEFPSTAISIAEFIS
jgi:predicted nucleic acid-binding protein